MSKYSYLIVMAVLAMGASFFAGVKYGSSSKPSATIGVSPLAEAAAPKAERAMPAMPAMASLPVETPAPAATPTPALVAPSAAPASSSAPEDFMSKYYGQVFNSGPKSAKIVALTFDDGPSPAYNARFISTLQKEKATATFFMIGRSVEANPNLVKNVVDAGFEIGIHTMTHVNPARQSIDTMRREMLDECELIQGITGQRPHLYRPPYGSITRAERDIARENGLVLVNWSVDTEDWRVKDGESIHARAMRQLHPGAVILMHEIKPNTIDVLPRIIADIRAQGYEFVTVSKLIEEASKEPAPALGGGGAMNEPAPAPQAIPIGELKGMMRTPQNGKPAKKSM